jgi:hypothetical protein
MAHSTYKPLKAVIAVWLVALTGAAAMADEPNVVWVDNESFGFTSCASVDALPGSEDPKALMTALRERGLADANQLVRSRGLGSNTVTLTPVSGSVRCGDASSSVVFRVASFDRASGQSWTSNLVSRMPQSALRSTDPQRSSR